MLEGPEHAGRRRRRRELGRRLVPWLVIVVAVGALAVALGLPWWLVLIAVVFVLGWIVLEP